MGTVHNFEQFRASRSNASESVGPRTTLLKLKDTLKEPCPGCGEQRSIVIIFHGSGASAGAVMVSEMSPHLLCDGQDVIVQDISDPLPSDWASLIAAERLG